MAPEGTHPRYKLLLQILRLDSQQHGLWVFHELLEMLQPLCTDSSIHNPMIAGHGDPHHVRHSRSALRSHHHLLLGAAHGEDAGLGRVDDGRELVDPEHTQVGDGEGSPLELLGL